MRALLIRALLVRSFIFDQDIIGEVNIDKGIIGIIVIIDIDIVTGLLLRPFLVSLLLYLLYTIVSLLARHPYINSIIGIAFIGKGIIGKGTHILIAILIRALLVSLSFVRHY